MYIYLDMWQELKTLEQFFFWNGWFPNWSTADASRCVCMWEKVIELLVKRFDY